MLFIQVLNGTDGGANFDYRFIVNILICESNKN